MFLVCAVETKFDENVNLLEIAERLKSPHIHNDPLKIIKEPKDGQYELTLRVIHMESRRVIRLHYKSNNAEFHYRLITVVVRHMDAFVVSEHDGDDITYELDK